MFELLVVTETSLTRASGVRIFVLLFTAAPDIVPVTSGTSSPTHALLPHVDTAATLVTSGGGETNQENSSHASNIFDRSGH